MFQQPRPSTERNTLSLALSAEEVMRLLEDTTSQTRLDMTHKIAGAYSQARLSQRESKIAEQVFRLLLRDTELRVRVALAGYVKKSEALPHDIALSLARDVEEVALPVLEYSQVLTDEDLIELVRDSEDVARQLAVSKRSTVSDALSDALLEKDNPQVTSSLLANNGAEISDRSVDRLIDKHHGDKALMQALGSRSRLSVTAAEKLIHVVSSSLAVTLKQKYNLSGSQIDQEVEKTRESETLALVRRTKSQADIEKLIGQLIAFKRLSPSIILGALCQGDFIFFETSLARLSNIPVANARTLITDPGELGFRAIYSKSGLPEAMFPAVKLLLKVVRALDGEGEKTGSTRYANRVVERLLREAEESAVDNLSYIIALIRRVA